MRREMTWAQRGLRVFLAFVSFTCVLLILVFPVFGLVPGVSVSVNVPVKVNSSSSSQLGDHGLQCRQVRYDRYVGRDAEACEARSRLQVDSGSYEVLSDEDGRGTFLLALLPLMLAAGIVLYAVTMLTRVLNSLRDGDPFIRENADRMRRASLVVGVGGVAASGLMTLIAGWVIDHPDGVGFDPAFFPGVWYAVIVGIVLAVVAEVFRRGADIREDLEGVV